MSLTNIGQQITIYVGTCLFLIGLIGNLINIFVFLTVRQYRKTACTFYFLISSISNLIYLSVNLPTRILSTGFSYDSTRTSNVWCKCRQFGIFTFPLITLTCSCLSTIDQYFATSQNVRLRRLSQIKLAYKIVCCVILIYCLHGIPIILLYNISPVSSTCTQTNAYFSRYSIFYLLGLITTIPSSIMILFGYLTYRNLHQTRVLLQQQADRQLIRMILYIICLDLFCLIPYGIQMAYNTITTGWSKDANQLAIERFSFTILTTVTYAYYSVR